MGSKMLEFNRSQKPVTFENEVNHGSNEMHSGLKELPSDEKASSLIAISKLKDDAHSLGIRLNFALLMLPLEKANRLALYSAKLAIENHSSGHNALKWTLSQLHSFMDGGINKLELAFAIKEIEVFHNKSARKHSRDYLDYLKPCCDETIARMLVIIGKNFLDSDPRSCAFTCSSIGAWIASEFGTEAKDKTEQAHVNFIIRLLERPSIKLV